MCPRRRTRIFSDEAARHAGEKVKRRSAFFDSAGRGRLFFAAEKGMRQSDHSGRILLAGVPVSAEMKVFGKKTEEIKAFSFESFLQLHFEDD